MQLMQDPEETLKLLERLGFDGEVFRRSLFEHDDERASR